MKKRVLAALLVTMMTVGTVAGCGSNAKSDDSDKKASSESKSEDKKDSGKKVTVVTSGTGEPYSLISDDGKWTGSFSLRNRICLSERGEGNGCKQEDHGPGDILARRTGHRSGVQSCRDAGSDGDTGEAGGSGNASGGESRLWHYGAADCVVFRGRYDLLWPDQTAADAGVHRVWGDLLRHADVHDRTVLRGAVQRRGYDRTAGSGGQRSRRTAGTAAGQGSKTDKN